jgi:putative oxidoreductase
MKNYSAIGRILYALPFIFFGITHFIKVDWYDATYTSLIPLGPYTIMLTGVLLIAAGISIITKKYISLAALLLSALLLIFILTIHLPHLIQETDEMHFMMSLMLMVKDIALMGGSLMIAGMYSNQNETVKH